MARKANHAPTARPPKEEVTTVPTDVAADPTPSVSAPASPNPEPMPDYVRIERTKDGVVVVTRL